MNSRGKKNTRFAYAVDSPLVIYLAAVLIYPLLWGLYISFTSKTIGGPANFTGLKNYQKLLGDPEYRRSIMNTVVFTALSIAFKTFFGMLMALALNQKFKGRNLVRALLMIPWTLPNIVVVYNWRWIFNPSGGIANHILKSLHLIDKDLVWFGTAGLALFTVVVANVWRGTPFFGVSILAKLQTIPEDYYEAAELDGAGIMQKFRYITFPEVKDVTLLSMLMSTIWTINEFETIWLMTGGGPNGATEVMNVYSYKTAMRSMMLGRGIAVSVLAMPVLMILIGILTRKMLPENE
ncbi:MAG: sugar ABC transporter permease [Clostridiales bacterium]|nr:sugar ABC transporter permease [Clostridiales bacterium]